MTETQALYFRFKGSRNYIHGSDIFDALEAYLGKQGRHVLELSFRHFSQQQLECVWSRPNEEAVKAEGVAVDHTGVRTPFWLVATDEAVTERYAFDEAAITEHAQIEGKVIEAQSTAGYSVIEQIIVLTKALNYHLSPDVPGKWVFGQLRLSAALPAVVEQFHIRQQTMLAGRFSVQQLVLDTVPMGQIRFITSES